jgi:hypothetical protein
VGQDGLTLLVEATGTGRPGDRADQQYGRAADEHRSASMEILALA